MKIAEIEWDDAWIDTDDISLKKARKLKPCKRSTVGYLIAVTDDCVILSTDKFKKGKEVSAPMVIPVGMITDWWIFE